MRYASAIVLMASLAAGIVGTPGTVAGSTLGSAEQCRVARYKAASKYLGCQAAALGREVNPATLVIGGMSELYQKLAARCRAKYFQTRAKWTAVFPGDPLCGGPRFVYPGDGTTILDFLTGLVWEIKTDDDGLHDKDNLYSWSASGTAPDGTVFTTFLKSLNTSPCFGGACDWRLPTLAELQTILDPVVPCVACVDPNLGVYSTLPTWTSTEDPDLTNFVREVSFAAGNINNGGKNGPLAIRAVRGGFY